eukprot:CAMPEP_0168623430 /NCGR_PEP_ID=MMETSP0449_2-20121227/8822_1 /TAXON_ID=1082188 /ORGANISM="Strombidium rassoulzadegani, Strain ras09" /LENGTH=86 /DNA_ID=CAMNT_0008664813 /DNA_START=23 /DNA_END=283 /DNA_ORIENTATION=+
MNWEEFNKALLENVKIVSKQNILFNNMLEKYNMWLKFTFLPQFTPLLKPQRQIDADEEEEGDEEQVSSQLSRTKKMSELNSQNDER